jgi:hypothetical protein
MTYLYTYILFLRKIILFYFEEKIRVNRSLPPAKWACFAIPPVKTFLVITPLHSQDSLFYPPECTPWQGISTWHVHVDNKLFFYFFPCHVSCPRRIFLHVIPYFIFKNYELKLIIYL